MPFRTLLVLSLVLAGCARKPWQEIPVVELQSPAPPGSLLPHLAASPQGTVVMSWVEPGDADQSLLRFSVLEGERWGAAHTAAQGSGWFLNWADFPSVVPIDETHWAAHWLVRQPGDEYAYSIAIAVSGDGGKSWTAPVTPHLDGTPTEHGFVSLFDAGGQVAAAWLDGREMIGADAHDHAEGGGEGTMTLRAARIGFDGRLHDQFQVDDRVCDCCQTAATPTPDGVLLAFRDRTTDEVRDISVTRFGNDAWKASAAPRGDGWKIAGCPVNGPAIDASGSHVALAWFTAADNLARVRLALSHDAGRTFGDTIDIAQPAIGRTDVVALGGGGAVVSWLSPTADGAEIRLRHVDRSGKAGPARTLGQTTAARSSGFPQLERRGPDLVVAWTIAGEPPTIRTVLLEDAALE